MTMVPSSYLLWLVTGQPVRVKEHPQYLRIDWKPGVVLESIAPLSYLVEVNGPTYRRSLIHLRDAIQSKQDCLPVQEPGPRNPPAAARADPAQSTGPLENID